MNERRAVEKSRVRERIEDYFASKTGFDLGDIGRYEKMKLGGGTYACLVELTLTDDRIYYALFPVAQAHPLGIVVLHSGQFAEIIRTLMDGLTEDF